MISPLDCVKVYERNLSHSTVTSRCDFEARRPGGLRGLMGWMNVGLSQMSGTVTALDGVTCCGNCKVSERGAGQKQKGMTDVRFRY